MPDSRIHFSWKQPRPEPFRTAVSLHSHTLHSRETMEFISRATANVPWLGAAIRKQEELYHRNTGFKLNLADAWWTPPLSARRALQVEEKQIENVLDSQALVSLSDHDNIEAGLQLHVLEGMRDCPISVEWTVPYRGTFFHLGIHNLPYLDATAIMRELAAFTREPVEQRIGGMLEWLAGMDSTLIVMNHPCWDEKGIGAAAHAGLVNEFLAAYRRQIHALELNGLRPWKENQRVLPLAQHAGLPLISGGDRHGIEPNACVNLTDAPTFAEFASEMRNDGRSRILFMPQYREPFRLRVLENMFHIMQEDPRHSLGWVHWSHRVFYCNPQGVTRSLAEIWGNRPPAVVHQFVRLMMVFGTPPVRSALRFALAEREESAL